MSWQPVFTYAVHLCQLGLGNAKPWIHSLIICRILDEVESLILDTLKRPEHTKPSSIIGPLNI